MKTCKFCGITSDLARFIPGKRQCRCCHNENMAESQRKKYKENHDEIRKAKNEYKNANRERYNMLERERYRKQYNVSPLVYRKRKAKIT